jgi:hypothetical protein
MNWKNKVAIIFTLLFAALAGVCAGTGRWPDFWINLASGVGCYLLLAALTHEKPRRGGTPPVDAVAESYTDKVYRATELRPVKCSDPKCYCQADGYYREIPLDGED